MTTAFIAIGAISLGGIVYRFATRMVARQSTSYGLDEKAE